MIKKEYSTLQFTNTELSFKDDPLTGDTIFSGVTILAAGQWTDSLSKKTITYSENAVKAMKFERRTLKAQHDIFNKLPITNEIGIIENEKYETFPNPRWVADVRIYPTVPGQDMVTLLKHKHITDISPELYHVLTPDSPTTFKSEDIIFMGAAPVRTGACRLCTFNEGDTNMSEENPKGDPSGATNPDLVASQLAQEALIKEQNDKIDALTKQVAELAKEPIPRTFSAGGNMSHVASELDNEMYRSYRASDLGGD